MTMSKKTNKKQLKITKLLKKSNRPRIVKENHENDELHHEIQELEEKLREKQNYLFQLQRESLRHKAIVPKTKADGTVDTKALVLKNRIETWKRTLDVTTMLTGLEVESYDQDHCSVTYHMQHDSDTEVKHGVTITNVNGKHEITSCALPLGFNLKAVLDSCKNEVSLKTFDIISKALTAHYARLEQYDGLKKFLNIDATLFKTMDGTQIEFTFVVKNDEESDVSESLTFILFYTIFDIRPKDYAFKGLTDKPKEVLQEQFSIFKKYPLKKAFKMAFIEGDGSYKLIKHLDRELNGSARRNKRPKPTGNNDDTFQVEDCSESSDDAEE